MPKSSMVNKKCGKKDLIDNKKHKRLCKVKLDNEGYHDSIKNYLKDVSQYKLLTFEEEKSLSKKIQNGDKEALDLLVNSNLRLVIKIAKLFTSKEYQLIDIVQDGNIGLIRAAEKYDYRKNVRFSTYASSWIKQTIIRALAKKKKIIPIPYRKEKELKVIHGVIDEYMDKYNRYPTNKELSKKLGVNTKQINKIKLSDTVVVYFEDTINSDQSASFENFVTDNNYNPYETLINKNAEDDTKKALNSLLPKEKAILIHRFGIDHSEKYTLKEIGNFFGISPETVRQVELKTLKKLRTTCQNLKNYIYN